MKPLNILYIAHERKLGGATLALLTMIDEMAEKGHKIRVVIPTSHCPLAEELKKRNIPFYAVFFAWIQMPSDWNPVMKACFRLLYLLEPLQVCYVCHLLKGKKPDVIHTNSGVTDFGAKLAKKLHCKHVWHIREFGDADYNLEYLKGKKKAWSDMNLCTDRFLFISKCLYGHFRRYADQQKSRLVYDGLPKDYIIYKDYPPKEKVIFLISGNLARNKGQMLLLRAAKELKDQYGQFEIWLAGSTSSMSDSKRYTKELQAFIDANLSGTAVMLGRVADMHGLREKADVEIVASNREAFGRVTIEAMLGGMPVIGSNSGANPELISDGIDGVLFENGNYKDLAAKMEIFLTDRSQIRTMGKKAFAKASGRFTSHSNTEEIEKLYYSVLGSGENRCGNTKKTKKGEK